MKRLLKKLWEDESGATAIEYGLIAGIMAALLVTALGGFSDKLSGLFDAISEKLNETTETIKKSSNDGGASS
ncbi:MAG: Flp family type IVb pilin [Desulfobacterium sp.]|nr:Flp family type IVb pilin [Desulfobacterium sp.]